MEEKIEEKYSRRELLRYIGAAGISATSGCVLFDDSGAPELENQAERTEGNLRQRVPWGSYRLNFDLDSLNLGLEKLGATGVEDAHRYRLDIEISLADSSDDLFGYLGKDAPEERIEEFFRLYSEPAYDILNETYREFQDFTPPRRPSHKNQVIEYSLRFNGDECSYIEDTITGERMDELLRSRSHYREYLNGGEQAETVLEEKKLRGLIPYVSGC